MRELTIRFANDERLCKELMPEMISLAKVKHFAHYSTLHTTLWKALRDMAAAPHVASLDELFFEAADVAKDSLSDESRLVSSAAKQFIQIVNEKKKNRE